MWGKKDGSGRWLRHSLVEQEPGPSSIVERESRLIQRPERELSLCVSWTEHMQAASQGICIFLIEY